MKALDQKIISHFEGKVVRKDLTKFLKGNAVVPSYVLEYLLGQHCSTNDEEIISIGIEKVKGILSNHFVHRDEAEVIKSKETALNKPKTYLYKSLERKALSNANKIFTSRLHWRWYFQYIQE
ncbi:anti-phage BREX system Lon protease BrxL [Epilithonimonas tenax]|uniref:anti-phage BREX system Lon protease BrxL n=1 Tax=Epilithonimonas tenax TaxID=191577 RepID=UPI000405C0BE|nr:anti-phage BREX system Lon protease BrxL [Epilithonimonas tenax]